MRTLKVITTIDIQSSRECLSILSRDIENILKDLNKASRNEKYNV